MSKFELYPIKIQYNNKFNIHRSFIESRLELESKKSNYYSTKYVTPSQAPELIKDIEEQVTRKNHVWVMTDDGAHSVDGMATVQRYFLCV